MTATLLLGLAASSRWPAATAALLLGLCVVPLAGRRRLASQNPDFANIRTATIRKYRNLERLAVRNSTIGNGIHNIIMIILIIIIIMAHICKNSFLQSPSLVRRR